MTESGYRPNNKGLTQIAQSGKMSRAMVSAARDVAGTAESAGKSTYSAEPKTVTAGYNNEKRAGAVIVESKVHLADWRDQVLKRTSAAMKRRG